jgi:type VI secretion system protein ImpB
MSSESVHDKLERVRKPRVHITYQVETEGAMVEKELPFVVGVLGDFSGNNPGEAPKALKDRKFVGIDRDNFNDIMKRIKPGVSTRVENTLTDEGSELSVALKFNSIDDFSPGSIVQQVEPLRKLLEARDKIRDLMSKVDRSEDLEGLLEKVLQNTEQMQKLNSALGLDKTGAEEKKEGN